MKNYLDITEDLYDYVLSVSLREPALLRKQREKVAKMPMSAMQSVPEESQLLVFLIKLMGAKRIIELGTFTGYSTLWMAKELPPDGKIITCDIDEDWTAIARDYWKQANVEDKIDSRIGPAIDTLDDLIKTGHSNYFDFIYIDADKQNYINYYERALKLVRPGGLIGIDNVLWGGSIVDPVNQSAEVMALRELNSRLLYDNRVTISMLTIADGLTLAIRNE
ncbi:class I SAM-dependent methyltransferase [Fulvivirga kasyanovii]|uniref:SAM-dependent methyltransferase n=1 Tax=Fulvivirga kasyanovii TaxID=396812 RepID=A0ABW9RUQ8_9BACT|nr:class I SAM-dependent methyltransferase [Fulvivirga kasyanovii]MTI27446.1 SAM-dependent methyltransferase [Fulvivirga kasyanovii]